MMMAIRSGITLALVGVLAFAAYTVLDMTLNSEFAYAAKLPKLEPGAEMPAFALTDTTGTEHTLAQYEGKVVVLNFSSSSRSWRAAASLPRIFLIPTSNCRPNGNSRSA